MSQLDQAAPIAAAREIPGVIVRELVQHGDERGFFCESFRQEWFPGRKAMVQGNRSDSQKGVLRGLHFHRNQADYWYVPRGRVLVALADLRRGSPTERAVATLVIGDGAPLGVYIPPGVAHGYLGLTDCTMTYMVDQYYDPSDELGVAWNDPELAIDWRLEGEPVLSGRDQQNPTLEGITEFPPFAS